jgi:hypothetical protein
MRLGGRSAAYLAVLTIGSKWSEPKELRQLGITVAVLELLSCSKLIDLDFQ